MNTPDRQRLVNRSLLNASDEEQLREQHALERKQREEAFEERARTCRGGPRHYALRRYWGASVCTCGRFRAA